MQRIAQKALPQWDTCMTLLERNEVIDDREHSRIITPIGIGALSKATCGRSIVTELHQRWVCRLTMIRRPVEQHFCSPFDGWRTSRERHPSSTSVGCQYSPAAGGWVYCGSKSV
jgi:hypothetical protein